VTAQLHRIGPLVALLVGVYALVASYRLSLGELTAPGPGLWPFMVAMLITAVSAILLVIDDPEDYEPWTRGTLLIVGGFVTLGVFIVLFKALGFLIPAMVMLLLWLKIFGEEPWKWAVPLAVGGALGLYLVFVEALGVPFPEGALLSMSALGAWAGGG
jgi:putative tricarboxylic transport membrane protein